MIPQAVLAGRARSSHDERDQTKRGVLHLLKIMNGEPWAGAVMELAVSCAFLRDPGLADISGAGSEVVAQR
jgi:hypothetical protein